MTQRIPDRVTRAHPSLSVVVPTRNEEKALPYLLEDLRAQTVEISEVIVADAESSDHTRAIALWAGCTLVPGGLPALGRNAGAARATGDWLLFLDADVRLPPDALEVAVRTAENRRLDGLSTWFVPDRGGWALRLGHHLSAWWFLVSSALGWPHSIGGFLLVKRRVHRAIGGFDVGILVAEDQDYVVRLARRGRYAFVRRPRVRVSVRRFEADGGWTMNFKWIGIELHRIFRGEIRDDTFHYFKAEERGEGQQS